MAEIVAIVTNDKNRVQGGGTPIFIIEDQEMLEKVSKTLSKVLDASAHTVDSKLMIIVQR